MFRTAVISIITLLVAGSGHAATIHVPGEQPTIQAGVDVAAAGDTVLVAPGIYTGPGNHDLDFAGIELVLRSATGAENTVLDIQGSSTENRRGIHFHTGEGPAARVEGFTFRNGFAPHFGELDQGGGILIELCSPTIVDCVFEDNEAWLGGGIKLSSADPTIRRCVFRNNHASYGGAIDLGGASPLIENCEFLSNQALTGGALACRVLDYPIVRDCQFLGNSATSGGSAVMTWASHPEFETCLFVDSVGDDGVVKARQASTLLFTNCTFANNDARGGVLVPRFETGFAPSIRVENSIIAFNTLGPAVDLVSDGSEILFECTDIFGHLGGDWTDPISDQANISGNFSADPFFCSPEAGDFHIQSDSPCAPPGVTACGLVGALPVGCGPISIEEATWATIKGKYR